MAIIRKNKPHAEKRRGRTTAIFGVALVIAAVVGAGTLRSALDSHHIAARVTSLASSTLGLIGSIDLLRQSSASWNTPYTTAIYRAHFAARPSTPLALFETLKTLMSYLPLSAQLTVGAVACGLVTGVATTGYGAACFAHHGSLFFNNPNAVQKAAHKRAMIRGFLTAGCGVIAAGVSGYALGNIWTGISNTQDTHKPVLGPIRSIRRCFGI